MSDLNNRFEFTIEKWLFPFWSTEYYNAIIPEYWELQHGREYTQADMRARNFGSMRADLNLNFRVNMTTPIATNIWLIYYYHLYILYLDSQATRHPGSWWTNLNNNQIYKAIEELAFLQAPEDIEKVKIFIDPFPLGTIEGLNHHMYTMGDNRMIITWLLVTGKLKIADYMATTSIGETSRLTINPDMQPIPTTPPIPAATPPPPEPPPEEIPEPIHTTKAVELIVQVKVIAPEKKKQAPPSSQYIPLPRSQPHITF